VVQLHSEAAQLAEMITKSGKTLKAVMISHAHPDRFMGLDVITERSRAQVISPKNVVARFQDELECSLDHAITDGRDREKSDFSPVFGYFLLPYPHGSAAGVLTFEATSAFTFVTARWLAITPRVMPSIGSRNSVSLLPAIQATRLLTLASVGLSPTEHASLRWTHNRTCPFRASGFPTDFTN
jgi:Metallo-beta-lactamase superfamily